MIDSLVVGILLTTDQNIPVLLQLGANFLSETGVTQPVWFRMHLFSFSFLFATVGRGKKLIWLLIGKTTGILTGVVRWFALEFLIAVIIVIQMQII